MSSLLFMKASVYTVDPIIKCTVTYYATIDHHQSSVSDAMKTAAAYRRRNVGAIFWLLAVAVMPSFVGVRHSGRSEKCQRRGMDVATGGALFGTVALIFGPSSELFCLTFLQCNLTVYAHTEAMIGLPERNLNSHISKCEW